MSDRRVSLTCWCGFKTRRVQGECACYDEWAMSCCCLWGKCPNGHRLIPTKELKELVKIEKETDEFWKRHKWVDGKVVEIVHEQQIRK